MFKHGGNQFSNHCQLQSQDESTNAITMIFTNNRIFYIWSQLTKRHCIRRLYGRFMTCIIIFWILCVTVPLLKRLLTNTRLVKCKTIQVIPIYVTWVLTWIVRANILHNSSPRTNPFKMFKKIVCISTAYS